MTEKYKLYYQRALTGIFGATLALSLVSCGTNATENKTQDTSTKEPIESTETPTENQTSTETDDTVTTQEEKDAAAEEAISLMLDGANALKDSATDAANSDAVQEELERSLENFKVLSDFIFNGGEINGVTFNELSDEGKQFARNSLSSIDDVLEYLVPNYQERFRNWFTDTTANGLDALSDLRDEGLELWEEIQTKRNNR